jgi:glycosyltransferase involved in cell wall biosynthesis
VANPSVPLYDNSLAADVPADTIVCRARTWEPGYGLKAAVSAGKDGSRGGGGFVRCIAAGLVRRLSQILLQPDPQVLWVPQAVREGKRLLREVAHHAIVASGPPFSTFLVGALLSRATGLPLVLDYRDEWNLSNDYLENKRLGLLAHFLQHRLQRRIVRRAQALVATTRASARALEEIRASARSAARVSWIYNGFDPDDFPAEGVAYPTASGHYRLAYVGTFWSLTSVAPLVQGIQTLATRRPDLASRLEVLLAGRCTGPQQQLLDQLQGLPCQVRQHSYLPHDQAVTLMRSADVTCTLLADLPGAGRVIPAKVFEYMATGRPILAIAPRGELWELLRDYPGGQCLPPEDREALASYLASAIQAHAEAALPPTPVWDAAPFSRPRQARELAALLNSLLG